MQNVMGVDVGGTKILIGMVAPDGTISCERRYESRRGTQEIAIEAVTRAVVAYWEEMVPGGQAPRPQAVGMGLVGQVDHRQGLWVHSLATPIHTPYPLCDILAGQLRVPVYADNDVHCATLAEIHFGAGRTFQDFVYLNIGTGVAAGLVSEGRLIRGCMNRAGEVGHMTVDMDMGIRCKCGRNGCVEEFASGGGMLRYARSLFGQYPGSALIRLDEAGELFSRTIFAAAREGDPLAVHIAGLVRRTYLALLQDLINLMDPAAIVMGGGVFRDERLLPEVLEALKGWLPESNQGLLANIRPSALDPQKVGLMGASLTAYQRRGACPGK